MVSGEVPAAPILRLAVERQRRDLASPPDGFVWSERAGVLACKRMEALPWAGDGPKRGTPVRLEPWQVWVVLVLFGWVDSATGHRRYREASIWLPKGNGKTPLAALLALCVLVVGKGGEQVYSAATTQDQARLVFDAARDMLNLDSDAAAREGRPSIVGHFGLTVEEHRIKGTRDGRVYRPISAEHRSAEGIRPTLVVLDEVHVQADRRLYDNLKTAANKVDGSLMLGISTAGFDMSPDAIGWQLYTRARDILEGKIQAVSTFAYIVEADRSLDPHDFATWRQANPNLGVSVSEAGLKAALETMRTTPSERPSLEVKHLGWWQQTASAFIDVTRWRELADPDLSLDDLDPDQWEIVVGLDLAVTGDLSAAPVVAARTRDDGKREYRVWTRNVYLPAESVTVAKNPDYRLWAQDGWLTLLPGASMTYGPVVRDVASLLERFPMVRCAIDRYMASQVEAELALAGVVPVEVAQGAKTQSEPMKELEAAVLDGRLVHDGSPVAAMCVGNLIAIIDRNGNVAPSKATRMQKIDVAVALINALVLARLPNEDVMLGPVVM